MKIFSGHMIWIPENPGLYANWHLESQIIKTKQGIQKMETTLFEVIQSLKPEDEVQVLLHGYRVKGTVVLVNDTTLVITETNPYDSNQLANIHIDITGIIGVGVSKALA
ncbi:hypothetical protein NEP60_04820 [Escherichia coli]|nr:hypothetical protein [Escherichia coli]